MALNLVSCMVMIVGNVFVCDMRQSYIKKCCTLQNNLCLWLVIDVYLGIDCIKFGQGGGGSIQQIVTISSYNIL